MTYLTVDRDRLICAIMLKKAIWGRAEMPYNINQLANPDIVEVEFSGDISADDLREVTTKCIDLQKETNTRRFLVQLHRSEVVASFFDVYDLADQQYQREGLNRTSRIAVVLPTALSAQAAADFYETVCVNRGWNAQVHPHRQSALDWLMMDNS